MFYKVWSGFTKYIRSAVQSLKKPLEIQDFAIFQPVIDQLHRRSLSDGLALKNDFSVGLNKNLTRTNGIRNNHRSVNQSIGAPQIQIKCHINSQFIANSGDVIQLPNADNPNLTIFDSQEPNYRMSYKGLQQINFQALAKVCETDSQTVELILSEIFKAIADYDNMSMIGSMYRKDLSVRTPSIFSETMSFSHRSSDAESFHISNPNPQKGKQKFLGVREKGYNSINISPEQMSTTTSTFSPQVDFKFGKRVYVDNKMSNKDVLEIHLQQMRDKSDTKKFQKDNKLKEDNDFINFVQGQLRRDREKWLRAQEQMKQDFVDFNGQKKVAKQHQIQTQQSEKKYEQFNYFPFTYGEQIEKYRENLRHQQRNDLQEYMDNIKKQSSTSSNFNLTARKSYNRSNNESVNNPEMSPSQVTNGLNNSYNFNQQKMLNCLQNTGTKLVVQSLLDTTSPFKNPRNKLLIYDDHPQKEAAMKQARERHEEYLQTQRDNKAQEQRMMQEQADMLKRIMDQKSIQTQRRQEEMKDYLKQQMRIKSRENYATHFGPEERQEDVMKMENQKGYQKNFLKEQLQKQIMEKQEIQKNHNNFHSQFDQLLIESNQIKINEEKKRKKEKMLEHRSNLRETWDTQLKYAQEQKQKQMGGFMTCLEQSRKDCLDNDQEDIIKQKLATDSDKILNKYIEEQMTTQEAVVFVEPDDPLEENYFSVPLKMYKDKDEEVPMDFKNKYETFNHLDKQTIIEIIEKMKTPEPNNKWDIKLDEPKIKVYGKMKGSDFSREMPIFYVDFYFDVGADIQSITTAIHNPIERVKWDKDIEKAYVIDVVHNEKILLWYQRNKSQISIISQRDFAEKKIIFEHENKTYIYFTSVDDKIKPIEDKIVRAYTIVGIHVIELLEDGRIRLECLMQTDFNLTGYFAKLGLTAALSQLPNSLKAWFTNLEKWVKKMEKQQPNNFEWQTTIQQ
ncbi:UNKNOWN [Stylonychia lemnae]|uniref:START domain-containing protein n=1 Tax=Stylonychia lemnae TaxID=5949 RepID=A0A078APQ1_STYLE|nr:UNKNOWN [Stylonychia lemnae]|eukprot:CDW83282.1 UNKNOWN [Stylonychia lemnae]